MTPYFHSNPNNLSIQCFHAREPLKVGKAQYICKSCKGSNYNADNSNNDTSSITVLIDGKESDEDESDEDDI